jgi:hypothetical protein
MQVIEDFILVDISVVCRDCQYPFATPSLIHMPSPTRDTPVEADLHRILPHPSIRGTLVAMCPSCQYTWWLSAFSPHHYVPDLLVPTPDVEFSKKFGFAVLGGRKRGEDLLDLAMLALNGAWCAREEATAGLAQKNDLPRWLKLAAQELDTAMKDPSWQGNTHRYNYMMAEILRQMGDCESALRLFTSLDRRSMLPRELIDHQIAMARAGNCEPTLLPPHLVEEIFKIKNLPPPAVNLQNTPELAV